MRAALFLMLAAASLRADPAALLPKCQEALSACDGAANRLKAEVTVLQDSNKAWRKEVRSQGTSITPLLLGAIVGTVGGAASGAAANGKDGLAIGGIVGGGVGITIGLILEALR